MIYTDGFIFQSSVGPGHPRIDQHRLTLTRIDKNGKPDVEEYAWNCIASGEQLHPPISQG